MVSMPASIVVDHGFQSWSRQIIEDCQIGMYVCCFSAKHAAFKSKSKNRLEHNQDNVPEWRDMSIYC